jgi:predicted PurR-regulated permease PerM
MPVVEERFARRVAVVIAAVAAAAAAAVLVALAGKLLLVLFAALLFAVLLHGLAGAVARRTRLPRGAALGVLLVLLVASFVAGGVLVAPDVVVELEQLARRLPEDAAELGGRIRQNPLGDAAMAKVGGGDVDASTFVDAAGRIVSFSWTALVYLVVVLATGVYLAASPERYLEGLTRLFPVRHRERVRGILGATGKALQHFLLGRIASMIAVGALTGIGLHLMGLPFAGVLALVAGVLTFVPYVGPLLAGVPIVLVAMAEEKLLPALAFYTVVQAVEGFVITPMVQKRAVKLFPALTITAEVLFGWLFGPIGVVVSVPLAAALLVLVEKGYVEAVLENGEPAATPA